MHGEERELALVRRAAAGDAVALKLLLTKTRPRLRCYISRQIPSDLGRVADADDIVQETHVVVFHRIDGFQPRGADSFFQFTAAIAMNLLRNAITRHRAAKRGGGRAPIRRPKSIEDSTIAMLDLLAGPGHTPSRSVARHEAIEAVESALAELPDHYQQAVRLVHIEGCPVREAASRMGRTERAVHGLCRRGLKLMRNQLFSASKFLSLKG